MSEVLNTPFVNPLNRKLYQKLGRDNYAALMEMYSAVHEGRYNDWYDYYSGVEGHIDRCLKLSEIAEKLEPV